ncbi:MAG TPA: hypothetical protein VKP66_16040 [Steroidobacteraceae bacterium]|nr:hypothetical protein [Steroidobacteraceae bacterium]
MIKRVIAEKLDPLTHEVVGARTMPAYSVECRVVGHDAGFGIVQVTATNGETKTLRVGVDPKDYQQVRVYSGERLVETLRYRDSGVIHTND